MFGSKDLLYSSETYGVAKSLRFRSSASAYLNRTFSAGDQQKWTFSCWVKFGNVAQTTLDFPIIEAYSSSSAAFNIYRNANGVMSANNKIAGTSNYINGTAVYRDPSAWYHFTFVLDTTQSTASNRLKFYVNGVQDTTFANSTQIGLSSNVIFNSSITHYIGYSQLYAEYLDGYLAEVNFIGGQTLTPSAFGFYDNNGIWQPKGYTGTYGTNGFYLKFTDVGATSGANSGYGKDFSGFNTNYWTTNNFGTTSTDVTYDSMYDSPVNASNGITGIGNYCTWNPIVSPNATYSNGNLQFAGTGSNVWISPTMGASSGKYYWENTVSVISGTVLHIGATQLNGAITEAALIARTYYADGNKYSFNTGTVTGSAFGNSYSTNAVIGVAIDMTAGKIWFSRNGTWQASGDPAAGTNEAFSGLTGTWGPFAGKDAAGSQPTVILNCGQRPFAYTPPSGFSALNTQNLTAPTIPNGAAYMAAVTYQGATAPNTVTTSSTNSGNNPLGTTFQPDLVWIKSRSAATDHKFTDAVRGTTKAIVSNSTAAETTDTNGLTAFTASGFTVGSDTTYNNTTGPATYVAWEWLAGTAPTTNNTAGAGNVPTAGSVKIDGSNSSATLAGSIAATRISASTSAGFSVVTYTGNGSTGTVAHGLNAAPSMIIVKDRSTTTNWYVYHISLGTSQAILLNSTAAVFTPAPSGISATSATTFTLGGARGETNTSSENYVAWCWTPINGYSAFGSYTGNGSADGPFIFTNMKPRWILIKRSSTFTSGYGDWYLYDTSRMPYNVTNTPLYPNTSGAESSANSAFNVDILSNGFKVRTTYQDLNLSGTTYIYAAFAENPFKISRAR